MTGQESRRFGNLLAATTMLTYAVIATGAARASTGTASTCGGWPACGTGGGLPAGAELVAVGHRLLTTVAGVSLLVTLLVAWRRRADLRVRGAIGVAALLFGLQVAVGAFVAANVAVPGELHLVVAGAVFAVLLLALGWQLGSGAEGEPAGSGRPATDVADPAGNPAAADDVVAPVSDGGEEQ